MAGRPRIVIASPYLAESEMLSDWLSSDGCDPIRTSNCADAMTVVQACRFDLLIADGTFAFRDGLDAATRKHRRNAQTPIVVMGESKAEQVQADQKGAMYLGRPVDRATLQCTVSMALMEERPTRRSPRKPVNRIPAVVDGVPSHILDVSPEGLRLEIPRDRLSSLAPYFSVRVPVIGVSLLVQRMWGIVHPGTAPVDVTWYGGALSRNAFKDEAAWNRFVDAIPGARVSRP
jgi:DNA-binding response OmpR family regulator